MIWLRLSVLAVVLCGSVWTATGQIVPQKGYRTLPLGKDTLCFRYRFVAGDSLLYKVEAHDSIVFSKTEAYAKERFEWVTIICDSVTADGLYHLRYQVLATREMTIAHPSKDTAVRESSPWTGRSAHLVIDSLGRRIRTYVDDPAKAAITLGGSFQPLLLPVLDTSCGRQNQSWVVDDTTQWVENGNPAPLVRFQSLVRVIDKADTLGMRFHQLQYTQSGIGRMVVPETPQTAAMTLDATINAYGKLSIETSRQVPYHLFATSENKINVSSGGRAKEGRHLISMHYHLMQINSADPTRRYVEPPSE
ncbi:MAG: hypothetical protein FGM24_04025 [Candidatus Kapabacteria bacterium]|nr:hypothetical protein [Candidatus Kapabacteria bacterium]